MGDEDAEVIQSSRKRENSDNENDGGDSDGGNVPHKKSHLTVSSSVSIGGQETLYLKFLVPQITAGSVIGKAGANISELQKEHGVHIRMSKANDVFPGTDSRVALMSGSVTNVLAATMVIFKRMTSPSDLFPKNPRPKSISDKEISLIVPQTTAGLIIGKGGSRVKAIQEEAKCHINLTQKSEQLPTNERVVTIQNNNSSIEHIEKAMQLILDIIKTDPSSGSCLMINYSSLEPDHHGMHRGRGSRRDDYHDDYYEDEPPPPRRHWGRGGDHDNSMNVSGGVHANDISASLAGASTNSGGGGVFSTTTFPPQAHFWCSYSGPPIANGHTPPPHMLDGMKAYLLNVGYPLKAAQEIISASNILASYGVLKPGNIAIFNTAQPQPATNPFNTMAGNGAASAMNLGGYNSMTGGGGGSGMGAGWNNLAGVGNKFANKFQGGGGGPSRGGFHSGYGMRGPRPNNRGGRGGYGKSDMQEIKRRY